MLTYQWENRYCRHNLLYSKFEGKFMPQNRLLGQLGDQMQHILKQILPILLNFQTTAHRCSQGTWCHKYCYEGGCSKLCNMRTTE